MSNDGFVVCVDVDVKSWTARRASAFESQYASMGLLGVDVRAGFISDAEVPNSPLVHT